MKLSFLQVGLLIATAIILLNYVSGKTSFEPAQEEMRQETYSSLLWIASVHDDGVTFRFNDEEIHSVQFETLARHVKSRAFNIITGSINPVFVTVWKSGSQQQLLILDPVLKKIQLELVSDFDIYFDVTDDNRIIVEHTILDESEAGAAKHIDATTEWPQL